MDSLKICMLAVVGVAAALIVKQWKSDFLPLLHVALVILFAIAALRIASPVISYLSELTKQEGLAPYAALLLKALSIAILTQCCAEICRECGEGAAANGVELTGKIEILLLSLPMIHEILSVAGQLLSLGE
ncbi:MAG: hypothetical protein IKJ35_02940 [Clostridia bacterium]|nr:hypothetical protein [Clostridia bacterium]